MKNFSVKVLCEIAIFAAIGFALDLLQGSLFGRVWVNGGSIGIAMVPIFIISYRRGLVPGIMCGLLLSLVQMLGGVYVFQGKTFDNSFLKVMGPFFQIMLDYILAYTLVGVAGAFSGMYKNSESSKTKMLAIILGCIIGGTLKFIVHFLSGGFFWLDGYSKFAGIVSDNWLYSFVYNISYCLPCIVLSTIIMVLIAKLHPEFIIPDASVDKNEVINNEE
ncbi:MAG: energy-coupled thiamine transporter ThiT [bacterium]|nr:energy-coupled thiamine transporter ThiT [bacterium]